MEASLHPIPGANSLLNFSSLLGFAGRVGLGAKVAGGRARVHEVAGESRGEEGAENNVGALKCREREPQQEDELEHVVEGEPVDNANKALNNAAKVC